jgi:aminoglycoside phosphotransferase family enzyme/predicted kinase
VVTVRTGQPPTATGLCTTERGSIAVKDARQRREHGSQSSGIRQTSEEASIAAASPSSPAPGEAEITAFLADRASYPSKPERVDVIETHAARVFLAGAEAIKVKKHVRLPYLDFSTLEQRRTACTRELELNRPGAPEIYLGLVRITREADGGLAFDGAGAAVEFAIRMRRFEQTDLLSYVAKTGRIDRAMAKAIADVVADTHEVAPITVDGNGVDRFATIITDVATACAASGDAAIGADRALFVSGATAHLDRVRDLIAERARQGFRRRCHGDLHLANLVLWRGKPMPFDALEFDEALATIDVLYDLAFLLMDLERQGLRGPANDVLNRYLWRTDTRNLSGLAALPRFLALRAGDRAMVHLHRIAGAATPLPDVLQDARGYLAAAVAHLTPARPCLVAVGGLSGSGKSTLAAALAPTIGTSPGAVHLRSDLERKRLFGAGETERLPEAAYAHHVTERVYATLNEMAASVLAGGYSVVVDAVHAAPAERDAVERVARLANVPFVGIWLDAPGATLVQRVDARRDDASDATGDVVARQLGYDLGTISWHRVDASGAFRETRAKVADLIAAVIVTASA